MSKEEKPLTREDVLRLIEKNGGPKGLDLSGRKFEDKVDLSGLDLAGIIMAHSSLFRAEFSGSNLNNANLSCARLTYAKFNLLDSKPTFLMGADMRGASLDYAEFREADLTGVKFGQAEKRISFMGGSIEGVDLRGANLFLADFRECFFYGTKLQGAYVRGASWDNAHLEEVDWGNYVVGEEKAKQYGFAETYYRRFKMWYSEKGFYDVAGEFFYREMEAKRKALQWWRLSRIRYTIYGLLSGYGERPSRVIISGLAILFGLALLYFLLLGVTPYAFTGQAFLNRLYYSTVSFTALGYGNWAATPRSWAQGVGAAESVIGVFIIALFLVTFTRKMTR